MAVKPAWPITPAAASAMSLAWAPGSGDTTSSASRVTGHPVSHETALPERFAP
jgi:hypothetical protein